MMPRNERESKMSANANQDKRTASQKIEDLERAVMSGFQVSNNMARDLMMIKDALKLLGNKVDSIMKASREKLELNDENISKLMLENNIAELKGKVENLVTQGILKATEEVGDNTFLVGSENDKDGKVVHPRVQFTYGSLEKDLQEKLKGAKAGQIVTFKDDKLRFVVQEVYAIIPPKAPEAPAPAVAAVAPAAPAETPAEAAPAASQSSSDASPAAPAAPAAGN
jgi:hypothetical protein